MSALKGVKGKGPLQIVYSTRARGNSDNLLSNSSTTLFSALSHRKQQREGEGADDNIDIEEYKSEDERHREVNESSEDRSSCQSDLEDNEEGRGRRRRRGHGDVSGKKNFENYRKRADDDK